MNSAGIGAGLARLLGAVLLVIATLAAGGCGDLYSREDFTGMVMGKSEREVVSKLGKPAVVDDSDAARVTWTYNSGTFDLDHQNKRDSKALVIFERKGPSGNLMVTDVQFKS
jgi:hypothetical protein